MTTIFFTGFPGFLGRELLPRVLGRDHDARALCLVQDKFFGLAESAVAALERDHPALAGRISLATGDIVAPDLGLGARLDTLRDEVTSVYHLAAVYDLAVTRDLGMRVNVDGTQHVVDFARRCARLERLHYVSTCYVSGRYPGRFYERDLELGQTFNNFYEETKHLAEVRVRAAMAGGLPATIYRPAVVVGDQSTGATQKYDGPYFLIRWLLRQPAALAVVPVVGHPKKAKLNVAPRDFIVDAIAHLSGVEASAGKTYHLADPRPLPVSEMIDACVEATGRRALRIPVPSKLLVGVLEAFPALRDLVQIPPETFAYFEQPTEYDTTESEADLSSAGIACPHFDAYVDRLVAFVRAHPEFGSQAMV
ncbi:MAG: SDR family oxidoreductase [Myxococcales bacterium]|nr:SDR family oxidoreductase [Myxococcales bacterium]